VGGSSIEASKIAGHSTVRMTEEYTKIQLTRQEELTRRIQERLASVGEKQPTEPAVFTSVKRSNQPAIAEFAQQAQDTEAVLSVRRGALVIARLLPLKVGTGHVRDADFA
jgi:hypothetical protein